MQKRDLPLIPVSAIVTGNSLISVPALTALTQRMPYNPPTGPIDPAFVWDAGTFEWVVARRGLYFINARIFIFSIIIDAIGGTGRPNWQTTHVIDVNFGLPSAKQFRGERHVIHGTTPSLSAAVATLAGLTLNLEAGDRIGSRVVAEANGNAYDIVAFPSSPTAFSYSEITRIYAF
jgi:hypothetical protein